MYLYYFNQDLSCRQRSGPDGLPAQAPMYAYLSEKECSPDQIRATEIIGGVVQGIEGVSGPEELFLHAVITAPGSGPTGVPSVASGETATVAAAIRAGADPASDVVPYTGTVRAPYRMNGAYHGELRMELADGVCAYVFIPQAHHHGKLTISEDDIGLLQGMKIRLVGQVALIVDEKSAA